MGSSRFLAVRTAEHQNQLLADDEEQSVREQRHDFTRNFAQILERAVAVNDRPDERMKVKLLSFVLLTVDMFHSAKCPQLEQEAKDTK